MSGSTNTGRSVDAPTWREALLEAFAAVDAAYERRAEVVIAAHDAGLSMWAIAGDDRVCSVANVGKRWGSWNAAIQAAGFEPHTSGPVGGYTPLTPAQRAEIPHLYELGWSLPQLAARYGCSITTARRWVAAGGVALRPPFGQEAAA